jgi:hypothetical protein
MAVNPATGLEEAAYWLVEVSQDGKRFSQRFILPRNET